MNYYLTQEGIDLIDEERGDKSRPWRTHQDSGGLPRRGRGRLKPTPPPPVPPRDKSRLVAGIRKALGVPTWPTKLAQRIRRRPRGTSISQQRKEFETSMGPTHFGTGTMESRMYYLTQEGANFINEMGPQAKRYRKQRSADDSTAAAETYGTIPVRSTRQAARNVPIEKTTSNLLKGLIKAKDKKSEDRVSRRFRREIRQAQDSGRGKVWEPYEEN